MTESRIELKKRIIRAFARCLRRGPNGARCCGDVDAADVDGGGASVDGVRVLTETHKTSTGSAVIGDETIHDNHISRRGEVASRQKRRVAGDSVGLGPPFVFLHVGADFRPQTGAHELEADFVNRSLTCGTGEEFVCRVREHSIIDKKNNVACSISRIAVQGIRGEHHCLHHLVGIRCERGALRDLHVERRLVGERNMFDENHSVEMATGHEDVSSIEDDVGFASDEGLRNMPESDSSVVHGRAREEPVISFKIDVGGLNVEIDVDVVRSWRNGNRRIHKKTLNLKTFEAHARSVDVVREAVLVIVRPEVPVGDEFCQVDARLSNLAFRRDIYF